MMSQIRSIASLASKYGYTDRRHAASMARGGDSSRGSVVNELTKASGMRWRSAASTTRPACRTAAPMAVRLWLCPGMVLR